MQKKCKDPYRFQGHIRVPTERTALINSVLLNQRKQQLTINVPNIQTLNPDRNVLTLCCVTPLTPGVQVGFDLWLNDLHTHWQVIASVSLAPLDQTGM